MYNCFFFISNAEQFNYFSNCKHVAITWILGDHLGKHHAVIMSQNYAIGVLVLIRLRSRDPRCPGRFMGGLHGALKSNNTW